MFATTSTDDQPDAPPRPKSAPMDPGDAASHYVGYVPSNNENQSLTPTKLPRPIAHFDAPLPQEVLGMGQPQLNSLVFKTRVRRSESTPDMQNRERLEMQFALTSLAAGGTGKFGDFDSSPPASEGIKAEEKMSGVPRQSSSLNLSSAANTSTSSDTPGYPPPLDCSSQRQPVGHRRSPSAGGEPIDYESYPRIPQLSETISSIDHHVNVDDNNHISTHPSAPNSMLSKGTCEWGGPSYLMNQRLDDNLEQVTRAVSGIGVTRHLQGGRNAKLVLVMVGLPARGKTHLARRIARYLYWLGHKSRVFNVGNYRRVFAGASVPHEFFDINNRSGMEARSLAAKAALEDLLGWLKSSDGQVAVYDATNSTEERRAMVTHRCRQENVPVIFIESVCSDPEILENNIRMTKLSSPDYEGYSDKAAAVKDFKERIAHYEAVYETLCDDVPHIKVIDVGRRIVVNDICGYLPGRIVFFLMNIHVQRRPIYISRHGESEYNAAGLIGGDSPLTERGQRYATALRQFVLDELVKKPLPTQSSPYEPSDEEDADDEMLKDRTSPSGLYVESDFSVWTSTLQRTKMTAAQLPGPHVEWRALDEINAGICDGMSYDDIKKLMPEEYQLRGEDKLRYRYPRGESYQDVIARLEPVIIELERQRRPVVIIGHQAVLRMLYGYLCDLKPEHCLSLDMPLHTVIKLIPETYGCKESRFCLLPREPGDSH